MKTTQACVRAGVVALLVWATPTIVHARDDDLDTLAASIEDMRTDSSSSAYLDESDAGGSKAVAAQSPPSAEDKPADEVAEVSTDGDGGDVGSAPVPVDPVTPAVDSMSAAPAEEATSIVAAALPSVEQPAAAPPVKPADAEEAQLMEMPQELATPSPRETSAPPPMPPSLRGTKFLAADQVGEKKANDAAALLQGQLSKMEKEESSLRQELADALKWGGSLQSALAASKQGMATERKRMQEAVTEKAKGSSKLLAAAHRHERSLEAGLKNTTRSLAVRTQALMRTRQRLMDTNHTLETAQRSFLATVSQLKRDQATESAEVAKRDADIHELRTAKIKSEAELGQEAKEVRKQQQKVKEVRKQSEKVQQQLVWERGLVQRMQSSLKNATRNNAVERKSLSRARRDLREMNGSYEAAKQTWQKTEVQMRFDQAAEAQQVSVQENNLHWLRAAKASEDAELKSEKAQHEKDLDLVREEYHKEQQREAKLSETLAKERTTAGANERMFKEEVTREVRRAQQTKAGEEALKAQLAQLQNFSRLELQKLAAQMQAMKRHEAELVQDRASLAAQLQGNISKVANLSEEVALANSRVDTDDAQRHQAEEEATKAQADMLAAKAVAKQLSGTVPQLLEQERLAHEQEEAEKAMRAQAAAQAKQQIGRLEEQYTTLVQGQIEQLGTDASANSDSSPPAAAAPASSSSSSSSSSSKPDDAGAADDMSAAPVATADQTQEASATSADADTAAVPADTDQDAAGSKASPKKAAPDLASDSQMLSEQDSQDAGTDADDQGA